MRIWRRRLFQWNSMAAWVFCADFTALAALRIGEKGEAVRTCPFKSTMRY
jgi:hypothetical protein